LFTGPTISEIARQISDRERHAPAPPEAVNRLGERFPHPGQVLEGIRKERRRGSNGGTDPDRAERTASSLTEENRKALALSGIAQALVAPSTLGVRLVPGPAVRGCHGM
jgi:hypothetical protein